MNTAIIDNSLCSIDFSPATSDDVVLDYSAALFAAGIKLLELDSDSLPYFPRTTKTSRQFIFRIEKRSDLAIARQRIFAYVTVPISFIDLVPEIKFSPVILEIPATSASLKPMWDQVQRLAAAGMFSMLRLTGDFSDETGELGEFIARFKKNFCQPIDICPLDTTLFGVNTALSAYKAGADSLTLCFGENAVYTSVEKYWFFLYTFLEVPSAKKNFENICRAAVEYAILVNSIPRGVKNINDILSLQNGGSYNIDNASVRLPGKQSQEPKQDRMTVDELLDELDFDDGGKDVLKRVLDDAMVCLADYDALDAEPKSKLN